jgi:hypothetical protein
MAAPTLNYEIKRNAAGDLAEVLLRPPGTPLPIDENDQAFCDFLTWASYKSPPENVQPFTTVRQSVFFADQAHLVDFCKRHSVMLCTREGPAHRHYLTQGVSAMRGNQPHVFWGLEVPVALPGEDANRLSGGLGTSPPRLLVTEALYEELGLKQAYAIGSDAPPAELFCRRNIGAPLGSEWF